MRSTPPAPTSAIAAYESATGRDLSAIGWSRHDGQALPPRRAAQVQLIETRIGWLPGGGRWLPVAEALAFQQTDANLDRDASVFAVNTAGTTYLFVDAAGQVVLSDVPRGQRVALAASVGAFVDRYLELLDAGEIRYVAAKRRMLACRGAGHPRNFWRAFIDRAT